MRMSYSGIFTTFLRVTVLNLYVITQLYPAVGVDAKISEYDCLGCSFTSLP